MPKESNQNTTRIVILGLLNDADMSGYDILNHVTRYFHPFTKVSTSSVYYLLEKMEKEGLVKLVPNKKNEEGAHSKKTHAITKKGKEEFSRLIDDIALMRFHDPIQLALVFFDSISEEKRKRILESRLKLYDKIESNIKETEQGIPKDIHNKYFHLAMFRGKTMIDTDKKILGEILKKR